MKNFFNRLMILTAAFAGIFLLNMLIMHIFFNTDVFNPVNRSEPEDNLTYIRLEPEETLKISLEEDNEGSLSLDDESEDFAPAMTDETGLLPENIEAISGNEDPDSTYYMTTGEVGFLENLSLLEKLEAYTLISKVGREEADRIYDMSMDGITYTEMGEIEAVLKNFLSKDEMDTLMELLEKSKQRYSMIND